MAGDISNGRRRICRERRRLGRALILRAVVGRSHWRWYVSVWCFYACARRLAMCLSWRLFARAVWRRCGLLLHLSASCRFNIVTGAAVVGIIQVVGSRYARIFRWTCCALVLRWRDDIIGRRHSLGEVDPGLQHEVIDYTWVEVR